MLCYKQQQKEVLSKYLFPCGPIIYILSENGRDVFGTRNYEWQILCVIQHSIHYIKIILYHVWVHSMKWQFIVLQWYHFVYMQYATTLQCSAQGRLSEIVLLSKGQHFSGFSCVVRLLELLVVRRYGLADLPSKGVICNLSFSTSAR